MYQQIMKKAKHIYEFVCLAGILLFALLPVFMVCGPEKYGVVFKTFSIIEILMLALCIVGYLVCFTLSSFKNTFRQSFSDAKATLCSYFSDKRYALIFLFSLVLSVISACFANDRTRAFSGTDFRPDGILMYLCFATLFVFASSMKNKYYKNTVMVCYVVSFLVISLVMVQQYYGIIGTAQKADTPSFLLPLKEFYSDIGIVTGHFYKGMTGTFYNSNHMGYYIAVCSGLFAGIFIKTKNIFLSIPEALLMTYSFWILIINNTFGAYIAVFAALCICAICLLISKKTGIVKSLLPIVIFLCVSILVSVSDTSDKTSVIEKNIIDVSNDVKNIVGADDKTEAKGGNGRWQLWIKSIDMISEKPLLGYGPDNLKPPSLKFKMKMDRAHNEFLEISSAIGIPAALFYYIGLISALISALKSKNKSSVSLGASIAVMSYIVSSLFGVFLFYTACHLFIMLGFVRDDII